MSDGRLIVKIYKDYHSWSNIPKDDDCIFVFNEEYDRIDTFENIIEKLQKKLDNMFEIDPDFVKTLCKMQFKDGSDGMFTFKFTENINGKTHHGIFKNIYD